MNPFHFGSSDQPLFGVYHPPQVDRSRGSGVVLCHATRDEYFLSHRAFRQLASQLARIGLPTLRFDYYGTGDSSGDDRDASVTHWKADVTLAIDELKAISGITRVSLIGLRVGASLAAIVASERGLPGDVEKIVLWDPVVSGRRYVEELRSRHQRFLQTSPGDGAADRNEALGFPLDDELEAELASIDLTAIDGLAGTRVFLAICDRSPSYERLAGHLQDMGTDHVSEHIPGGRIWEKDVLWSRELVPMRVIRRITSWVTEAPGE